MRNLIRAGLAAIVGMVLLAGCGAVPVGAPGSPTASQPTKAQAQSQPEACLALISALGPSALAELPSVLSDLSSDPVQALKTLKTFADNLRTASATLTNPKVKAQADKLSKVLKDLITQAQKAVKNPQKLNALGGAVTKVRTELTALGALCAGF